MKKGSIGIWLLWVILTIVVAGGEAYYYQFHKIPDLKKKSDELQSQLDQLQAFKKDQQAEQDQWTTKNLTVTGSSIKYPSDWLYKKVTYDTGIYEMFYNDQAIKDQDQKLSGDQARAVVEMGPNNNTTATLDQVISDEETFLKNEHPNATSQKKTLNGIKALIVDYKSGSQNNRIYYYVKADATAFLTCSWVTGDFSGTFDDMAASFTLGKVNS